MRAHIAGKNGTEPGSALDELLHADEFRTRHIGTTGSAQREMLAALGLDSIEALIGEVVPKQIRLERGLALGEPTTEAHALAELKTIGAKNAAWRSFIGTGYYNTWTPMVLQRNVIENPGWYTAYECLISRSGYTGEDGFEISVRSEDAGHLAQRLLEYPDVKLIGLAARDTLRLEAGLPLHGQDIGPETTIVEAGLGWAVVRSRRSQGKKRGGFPGAEVFLSQSAAGVARRMAGLVGEEPIPVRQGAALVDGSGREVGRVTSGTVSPSTRRAVMLAYLDAAFAAGSQVFAMVRDKQRPASVVALPFVEKRYKR